MRMSTATVMNNVTSKKGRTMSERLLRDARRLVRLATNNRAEVMTGEARPVRGGVVVDLHAPTCRRTLRVTVDMHGLRLDRFDGATGVCTRRLPACAWMHELGVELRSAVTWVNAGSVDAPWDGDAEAVLRIVAASLCIRLHGAGQLGLVGSAAQRSTLVNLGESA